MFLLILRLNAQDYSFAAVSNSYSQHNHFNKFEWTINFSDLINPFSHQFGELTYPTGIVRIQLVNILSYESNDHLKYSLGYHYQRNLTYDSKRTSEYRPFQQIEYRHKLRPFNVIHMLRINERYVENKTEHTYPLSINLQLKTSLNYKLKTFQTNHSELYLTAYSEEYFSLCGPLRYQLLTEYWTFLGSGYQWNNWIKLELGMGYEFLVRNSNKDIRTMIYPVVNVVSNFNWIN